MRARRVPIALLLAAACGSEPAAEPGPDASPTASEVGEVPAYPQRAGDPEAGYRAMLDQGYVGCGVPYSAYARAFGPAPASLQLPGRPQQVEAVPAQPVEDPRPHVLHHRTERRRRPTRIRNFRGPLAAGRRTRRECADPGWVTRGTRPQRRLGGGASARA